MRARTIWLVCAGIVGLTAGCQVSQGRSCDLQASGISMAATVIDDAEGVEAEIELEAGDMSGVGTSLQLCDDEGESLSINGVELELTETYTGTFKYRVGFDEPQAAYAFELHLGSDAREIAFELAPPPSFTVEGPSSGAEVSRALELELAWMPPDPGQAISIELIDDEILCLDGWSTETEDDGIHLIPAGTIAPNDPDAPDAICQAEYLFTRHRAGAYPSALHSGGSVDAFVSRSVRFASIP